MGKSLYIKITAMLICVALLGAGITVLTAPRVSRSDGLRVVTSFYPVYVAAQQIAADIGGVEVVNMVDGQFGCLHDYQMSPADRVTLESADVFVMNGAGAEPFLTAVLAQYTPPTVIDLSHGLPLIESGHVHDHDGDHAHEHEEYVAVNDHVWMSPARYYRQIEQLRDGLIAADPANAAAYTANATAYLQRIAAVQERLSQAAEPFADTVTVLMHDSLAYLAEDLDLHVGAALNVGEDSGVSAADLSAAEDALTDQPTALFLCDAQYDTVSYTYLQQIPQTCRVITVDTCVTGEGDAGHWLRAMTALCEALEAAYES